MFENLTRPKTCAPRAMVRSRSAGVFAAEIEEVDGQTYKLRNARRIFYWDGASSLSELATKGTSRPSNCKFPLAVDTVILHEVIEVIPMTEEACKSIDAVAVWSQHD